MAARPSISGLQRAQAANNRRIAALTPRGALGQEVKRATMHAHRYAVTITHVDTGATRAAHRMELSKAKPIGLVFISPAAKNPRTKQLVEAYAKHEHERGKTHAFYKRTVEEAGPAIGRGTGHAIIDDLKRQA